MLESTNRDKDSIFASNDDNTERIYNRDNLEERDIAMKSMAVGS